MTAQPNSSSRGSRCCSARTSMMPMAAPVPSAVSRMPYWASDPRTSEANTVPSGIMAPAPMSPPPSPTITARLKASPRMKRMPSLISRMLDAKSSFLVPVARRLRDRESEHEDRGDDVGDRVEPQRHDVLVDLERAQRVEPAEPRGHDGQRGRDRRADRERAVGRDERQGVGRRELVLGHEVRHRRVLRRAPEQRHDLDEERRDHEQPEAAHERDRADQRRRGRGRRAP